MSFFRHSFLGLLFLSNLVFASAKFPPLVDHVEQHGFTRLIYQYDTAGHPASVLIETLFGSCLVQEPLLLELLKHPQMERLTRIHQHGHWHYLKRGDQYMRFEHSVNVFVLVRLMGGSYEEQVSALLHDISHTVFSHSGAYCFNDKDTIADAYQDDIHVAFLKEHGFAEVLERYGLSIEAVHPKNKNFTILEQALPTICADRFEYNITGGVYKGLITLEEARFIVASVRYDKGEWYFINEKAALMFAQLPLYMTHFLWGGVVDAVTTYWLAQALRRAIELHIVTKEMVGEATDEVMWYCLVSSRDPFIKDCTERIKHYEQYVVCDENSYDKIFTRKFRGVNPLVLCSDGALHRLTELNVQFKADYEAVKIEMAKGWHVRLNGVPR